jgi:hypothetical protein
MTTAAFTTVLQHTTDAEFRAWGSEFRTQLTAAGLVRTADTGQIDWTTVVRAAANTDAGYEIWRFNDTQQATAPIFIKFFFGTNASTTSPRVRIQIGTGSNGSGTLTGLTNTAVTLNSNSIPTAATLYPSYFCHTEGFLGLGWKLNGALFGFGMVICRTADPSGSNAPTADGAYFFGGTTTNTNISIFKFTATTSVVNLGSTADIPCVNPGRMTATTVGSDTQVFPHFFGVPRVYPAFGVCTIVQSEIARGVTFTATLFGTTSHTFIALDTLGGPYGFANQNTTSWAIAMLWE